MAGIITIINIIHCHYSIFICNKSNSITNNNGSYLL